MRQTLTTLLSCLLLGSASLAPAAETAACPDPGAAPLEAGQDTVEATRPGPWRQDLKRQPPRVRVGGTRTVRPSEPAPADVTAGRWVPGYRPATPEALEAFEAWKASQAAALGASGLNGFPTLPTSNYAANLLGGRRVEHVPDEPIEYAVRKETYEVSSIDLRRIVPVEPEKEGDEGAAEEAERERESLYDDHSGLTWEEYRWAKTQAENAPDSLEFQEATTAPSTRAPSPAGVGFDAIVSNGSLVPPDPILAVGPGHLVAAVNSRYQVWDKNGTALIEAIPFDQLFAGVPNCTGVFDPFVDYDEEHNRFVLGGETVATSGSVTNSYLCLAATATNDPTGVWYRTSFRSDALAPATWLDYPHLGIGLEAIYITGNMFADGGGMDHVRAFALDKAALYAGSPVAVAESNFGSLFFTAQPAKLHGFVSGGWPAPGTPHPFIAHDGGGNSRIWHWSTPLSTAPVIFGTLPEAAFGGIPPSAKELGAALNGLNDTGSGRWYDAELRNGKLWASRNTGCNLGGGSAESCVDWVEIDLTGASPVLLQQQTGGAYGSADDFRYYPDLSVDRNGNVAIGYTKSSAATYTQVWVTGREFSDPPGTLQPETLQRAGQGTYTDGGGCNGSCDRWGDYTGMTVDPDGCTFWYLGQFSDGGHSAWATHIGSFRFGSCSTDSLVQVDKGTYTCQDVMTITVTDAIPIDAATVSARTTVTATGGDSETIPAGSWTGSDCAGGSCGAWTATLPVSGGAGATNDGTVNAGDGQTITVAYADPHPGHAPRSVEAAVGCSTRLLDGGYLTSGGCEGGTGPETYRDYMDAGESIAYTFGIYNPPTFAALTDVRAELVITGPGADRITVYDPVVQLGALDRGQLTAPVFTLILQPGLDAAGLRLSEHAFNLRITSPADGFVVPQVLTQRHLLQADDAIVQESACWNFESGAQGFIEAAMNDWYDCSPAECGSATTVQTVAAPFSVGPGCGSETRTDDPVVSCEAAGTSAFKSNPTPSACTTFATTQSTITDTALYSPVFGPAHTGNAPNGQPWFYHWLGATWYYRSDMQGQYRSAMGMGLAWDGSYAGSEAPVRNEMWDYPLFYGYFSYADKDWDSARPWDPVLPPRNRDSIGFGTSPALATAATRWRWAVEVYDADFGRNPLRTEATTGVALDDLDFAYNQFHADEQVGACTASAPVAALDRFNYLACPSDRLTVTVLDGTAQASVQVTVTSDATGDSERFSIQGPGPRYVATLPWSTGAGPRINDGTLLVGPADTIRLSYRSSAGATAGASAQVDCPAGDVVVDGLAGLDDHGEGDAYADPNETVDIAVRVRNNTSLPLHNVRIVVDSTDPAVDCIGKTSAAIGTIPAGEVGTNDLLSDPITFKVSGAVACADPQAPPTATFRVLILADGFAGPAQTQELTLLLDLDDLPGTQTVVQDFTTQPVGWVHRLGPGDDDGVTRGTEGYACSPYADRFFWRATGGNAGGGFFCWKDPAATFPTGNYGDLSDSALYSPVFKIGVTGTTLSFDHEYLFGWQGAYRVDGARVDYRLNGGTWRKLSALPYDGNLIFNLYCNPLCNGGGELGAPCTSETPGDGERIFNQLDQGTVNWRNVSGALSGLSPGDTVQFRWRVGSMLTSLYGISTQGGYGLDNVSLTGVVPQACDTRTRPDVGCGVVYAGHGTPVEVCGDGDALVEPTERWSVGVTLRNSSAAPAAGVTADLAVSEGSPDPGTVAGNPGSFGTLAASGGTGTATYTFTVGPNATCIDDLLFDVRNIVAGGTPQPDARSAFAVPVGGTGTVETATQVVDPLSASRSLVASALSPALTVPPPAYRVMADWDGEYVNATPVETGAQAADPLVAENTVVTTNLGAPFTLNPETVVSAVVDWTTLTHTDVTACTRVFLRTPKGYDWTLKAIGAAPADPYDVLSIYRNQNGGAGQYRIGLEEVASGPCKGQATLRGTTMTVTDRTTTGTWAANARVSLWDGTRSHTLKAYGAPDASPYDVTAIYDAAGPGTYTIRLEENGAGGTARLRTATLTATAIDCDAGCTAATPPAPPVADGTTGSPVRFSKAAGGDLTVTLDNATCSSARAVVLYGTFGGWTGYAGAVTGCDIGRGPTATFTPPAGSAWFNVIWVNDAGAGGHPGSATSGPRSWPAAGLCGVLSDDASDATCN